MSSTSTALSGKNIAVTGQLKSNTRNQIKTKIKDHGGVFKSSVTSDVNLLVCGGFKGGNVTSTKLTKALDNDVPVVDEDEFLEMIGE